MVESNSNRFFDRIDVVRDRLYNQKSLLEESLNNPSALFDKASEVIGSTRAAIFQIMNVYEDNERKMNIHEFQNFLCSIVNQYFSQTFNDSRIVVKVRNSNQFPSLFAAYFEGAEIIQFNILEKFYGIRDLSSEEEINDKYNDKKKEYEEDVAQLKNKLHDMEQARLTPYKWIFNFHKTKNKNITNKLYYYLQDVIQITFQKNKTDSGVDKIIEMYKKELKYKEDVHGKYSHREDEINESVNKRIGINIVEPLFTKHGYRLETERYNLF